MLSASWIPNETLQAVSRTFLHSLWQGTLAAALAGIILLVTRRSPARVRYNLLGAILLLSLLTTTLTFFHETHQPPQSTPPVISADHLFTANLPTPPPPSTPIGEAILGYFSAHAPVIMLIWAVIFCLKCIRLVYGFRQIYRIRRHKIYEPAPEWKLRTRQLAQTLGIRKQVQLLESGMLRIPSTIGFFKPCIFIPLGLLTSLPADQVETILLHELAHIRRKDYLTNILQSFTETVFFFNPALLWISARLREEREACCDDIVMAHAPQKGSYLHALVSFTEQYTRKAQLGMALGNKKNDLLHRVKRMLTMENKKLSRIEKMILTLGLVTILACALLPEQKVTAAPGNNEYTVLIPAAKPEKPGSDTIIPQVKKMRPLKDTMLSYKMNHEPRATLQKQYPLKDTIRSSKWSPATKATFATKDSLYKLKQLHPLKDTLVSTSLQQLRQQLFAAKSALKKDFVKIKPGAFELQLKKGQWRLRDSIWLQKAEQRKLRDSIRLQFNKKFQEELLEKKEQWRLRDSSIRLRMTELRKQRDSIRVQLNEKFREKKHEKIVVHPQKFNFDFRYNSPAGKKIDAR